MRLGNAGEDLHDLDSIEWYGQCKPECKGGGEFNCTVMSTWTNNENEDNRETTRFDDGSVGHSLCDVVLEQGKTSYLGPFSFDCQNRWEGPKKEVKGWIRRSEVENSKFQDLVLCPTDDSTEIRKDGRDGLVA